jgi:phage baseplate assembly protein W
MARTIYQYQLINTNPDRAIGVLLPFNKPATSRGNELGDYNNTINGKGLFVQSYSTEQQALSNLKTLLLTVKGERMFQPNFGTSILRLVFEQNVAELATILEQELTTDINYWLPYIVIKNIDILQDFDAYNVIIRLTFSVTESGANMVINLLASENSLVIVNTSTNGTGNQSLTPVGVI